ncbi:MAG: right-handed parallel beta-helix repeat-containing protein [Methanobrevibacter sp.]|nr:right-handed parallel beta-helix repeat-containing protein [Methanobrevibacter sp.]
MKNIYHEKLIKNNIAKKMIFTILLLFLFSIALSNVNAAEINISSSDNLGETIANAAAGDIINLNNGTYTNNVTNITINKNLTIQGNGQAKDVIIDAQRMGRIFTISGTLNLTFTNITFINGNITGNGGTIYNTYSGTRLTFINCEFINNTASSYGGAIHTYSNNFEVINCTFTSNRASHAGAIYSESNNFTLAASTFINNSANNGDYYGGAVYNTYSINSTVTNCTFINNTAGWAGAIFYYLTDNVTITNSTFEGNLGTRPGAGGGAIYTEGDNYNFINCDFTNNYVMGYGGAIIHHGANHSMINCSFTNNTAYISGGAVYVHNQSTIGTVTNNFTLTNCTFMNNTADFAGAVYNQCNSSTITNCNFIANNALNRGGAIYNSNNLNLTGNNFTNNTASNYGGVIYNNGFLNLSNNNMIGNSAGLGQMIYNGDNGDLGILNITYLNNSTHYVKSGQNFTLFATLTDDMGNTVTGGPASFWTFLNAWQYLGSSIATEGYLSWDYTVIGSLGDLISVTGYYKNYNGNNGPFLLNVRDGQLLIGLLTNSTITAPDCKVGDTITIFGLASDEDGDPIANTQITLTVAGQSYNVITGANGDWSLSYTPSTDGNFIAIISWIGNSTHTGFTNHTNFNVLKDNDENNNNDTNDDNNNNETNNDENNNNDTNDDDNNNETNDDENNNNERNNDDANNNETNDDENNDNGKTKRIPDHVLMKETGIPIIAILLVLLCLFSNILRRKQK